MEVVVAPFVSSTPALAVLVSMAAVIPISLSWRWPNAREGWTFLAALLKLVLVLSMLPVVLKGGEYRYELLELLPGASLAFRVDAFGMVFALVASSLWIVTSCYSIGYMRSLKEHGQTRYFVFFAVALAATLGTAFAGNLLTLYLFYELLSLSTYPLVTHHQDEEARHGGRRYLTYILGSSIGLVLPALIVTYLVAGTLDFGQGALLGEHLGTTGRVVIAFAFLFGFAKAGVMPFHSWLPGAMVAPTPVSALLHAVAVVKVGAFCILRVMTEVLGPELLSTTTVLGSLSLSSLLGIVASITILLSSLIALTQDNLKRRLAFSTIGQLSYIVLGAVIVSPLALKGALLHIVMHAFGKITLFFCAGAIFVASGKKYVSQMSGLGRTMPFTFAAFLLGSLSVIGLPPAGGLLSKVYLGLGTLDAEQYGFLVVLLVSSFLNACYFLPIVFKGFFSDPPEGESAPTGIKEAPLFCLVPLILTALASVFLFFSPNPFVELVSLAADSIY